ncbi:unnamed protein product, partial [Mesorhabditis spiculigera]
MEPSEISHFMVYKGIQHIESVLRHLVLKERAYALDWLPPPLELAVVSKSNDSLEITWSPPDMSASQHHIVINQYFINIYEFYPETQTFTKKVSTSIAIPKTSYLATRLNPGAVYNVTLQAGTTFGYGSAAWTATNTLVPGLAYILKQKARTPNSLTVAWPSAWMATPNAKFTILAKTVHSNERVQKEIMEAGFIEAGRNSEFQLKNLAPGSTYNVTLVTAMEQDKSKGKWLKPGQMKSTWGIFSTLVQGEYTIPEARVASETDTAASIVFQPLTVASNIVYQLRYATIDQHSDDPIIETRELKEEDLRCPKFGCEWKCFLFFNLKRRPREYTFSVRAKVDGVWNKWSPILRRQWNLLERPCSINPPSVFVEFIGNAEHQRILELKSAIRVDLQQHDTWRYLVVIDSRTANIATMDLTKLADKVTADYDHIPYYITASLTPEEVEEVAEFRLGDGRVYGGYLNYPLENADANPQYTLIPMSQQENEIMEPRLRSCGFTEQGVFECDMGLIEIVSYIPDWMKATIAVIIAVAAMIVKDLGAIETMLNSKDPPLQATAFSKLVEQFEGAKDDDGRLREQTGALFWRCFNGFGPFVARLANKYITTRVAAKNITLESVRKALRPQRNKSPEDVMIAYYLLLDEANISDTLDALWETRTDDVQFGELVMAHFAPERITSERAAIEVMNILRSKKLRHDYRLMVAENLIEAQILSPEKKFFLLYNNVPKKWLLKKLPGSNLMLHFLSDLPEFGGLSTELFTSPKYMLSFSGNFFGNDHLVEKAAPHPCNLPALAGVMAANGITVLCANRDVFEKALRLVEKLKGWQHRFLTEPKDAGHLTDFEYYEELIKDGASLQEYFTSLVEVSGPNFSLKTVGLMFGLFAKSTSEQISKGFGVLVRIAAARPELSTTLVYSLMTIHTSSYFEYSDSELFSTLAEILVATKNRALLTTVLGFLKLHLQRDSSDPAKVLQPVRTLFAGFSNIYDLIKGFCIPAAGDPLILGNAKLELAAVVCEDIELPKEIEAFIDTQMRDPDEYLPAVIHIINVLCLTGEYSAHDFVRILRGHCKDDDVHALKEYIKLFRNEEITVAKIDRRTEEYNIARTFTHSVALPQLFEFIRHDDMIIRDTAYDALSVFSPSDINEFVTNLEGPTPQDMLKETHIRLLDMIEQCDGSDATSMPGRLRFLHKMVAGELEELSRQLYSVSLSQPDPLLKSAKSIWETAKGPMDERWLGLFPCYIMSASESTKPATATRNLYNALISVELSADTLSCRHFLQYIAPWRAFIETCFIAVHKIGTTQLRARDTVCEVLKRALLEVEESLDKVCLSLLYLALRVQDVNEKNASLPFEAWLPKVVAFLAMVADPEYQPKTLPIFQCDVTRTDSAQKMATLALILLSKQTDTGAFDPYSGLQLDTLPKYGVVAVELQMLEEASTDLLSLGPPLNAHEYRLLEYGLGKSRLYIEAMATTRVLEAPKSISEQDSIIQKAINLSCMDTLDFLKGVEDFKAMIANSISSSDDQVQEMIFKALSLYSLSRYIRSRDRGPEDYKNLPSGSLIREVEARLRKGAKKPELLVRSFLDQKRTDERGMPPLSIAYMLKSELAKTPSGWTVLFDLAMSQHQPVALATLIEMSADIDSATKYAAYCKCLPKLLMLLERGYAMTMLNELVTAAEEGHSTAARIKQALKDLPNKTGLCKILEKMMTVPQNSRSFFDGAISCCVPNVDPIAFKDKLQIPTFAAFISCYNTTNIAISEIAMSLLHADYGQSCTISCIIGHAAGRMSSSAHLQSLFAALTNWNKLKEMAVDQAIGAACHLLFPFILSFPFDLPFNFLGSNDVLTFELMGKRIFTHLRSVVQHPEYSDLAPSLTAFFFALAKAPRGEDESTLMDEKLATDIGYFLLGAGPGMSTIPE